MSPGQRSVENEIVMLMCMNGARRDPCALFLGASLGEKLWEWFLSAWILLANWAMTFVIFYWLCFLSLSRKRIFLTPFPALKLHLFLSPSLSPQLSLSFHFGWGYSSQQQYQRQLQSPSATLISTQQAILKISNVGFIEDDNIISTFAFFGECLCNEYISLSMTMNQLRICLWMHVLSNLAIELETPRFKWVSLNRNIWVIKYTYVSNRVVGVIIIFI